MTYRCRFLTIISNAPRIRSVINNELSTWTRRASEKHGIKISWAHEGTEDVVTMLPHTGLSDEPAKTYSHSKACAFV